MQIKKNSACGKTGKHSIFQLILFFVLSCCTFIIYAQYQGYLEKNYSKKEYRIAMRDGKKLFTAVYSPKDTTVTYPILIRRTPYSVGPYG